MRAEKHVLKDRGEYPSAEELYHVRNFLKRTGQCLIPNRRFKLAILGEWYSHCKPPSKKHLGTNNRMCEKVVMTREIWEWLTSTERGLAWESKDELIERSKNLAYPKREGGCPLVARVRPVLPCPAIAPCRPRPHARPAPPLPSCLHTCACVPFGQPTNASRPKLPSAL